MQGIANKADQGKKPYKNEYQILTTVKNCYSSGPWILNHIIYCFDQEVMFEFKCKVERLMERHMLPESKAIVPKDKKNGRLLLFTKEKKEEADNKDWINFY